MSGDLPVIIDPLAADDLNEIRRWFKENQPGVEDQFAAALDEAFALVRRNPETFAVIHKGVRRAIMRRFFHGIFYRIDANQITVLAVKHPSQDPAVWRSRA